MDKKYTVFVSSTYEDLKEERQAVQNKLLMMDCFPVAMENFPSTDESSWDYIKALINECDFYVMILGGRYGSMTDEGISYTEKEYIYAYSQGLPIYVFIYDDHCLSKANCDDDPEKVDKLNQFKLELKSKICNTFKSKDDLASLVSTTLHSAIKIKKPIGWTRINQPIEYIVNENNELKKKIESFKELSNLTQDNTDWEKKLISSNDTIKITGMITIYDKDLGFKNIIENIKYEHIITWDKLFSQLDISPLRPFDHSSELTITLFRKIEDEALSTIDKSKYKLDARYRLLISQGYSHDILIHLIALGLVDTKYVSFFDYQLKQNREETRFFLTEKGKKEYCRMNALYKDS